MLARAIEAAGISTIFVTMVPYWAERRGVPRTLAVEFPFGHPLGKAGASDQQFGVIRHALQILRDASGAGQIEHHDEVWEGDEREWRKRWQPAEPSPIIAFMRDHAQQQAKERHQADQRA
ncbi:MAG: hypothetical protein J4N95_05350 [Chloroflexi bacterium]|nr:hypothetical protein [Chloroflexota bacterium]MCI0856156.1 hypothetical protein [Chloroflexota bacterium]